MSYRVRLPDGSHVTVNTTDRAAAQAAANKHWGQKKAKGAKPLPKAPPKAAPNPKAKPKRGTLMTISDFAGDMLDNATPNWGDEWAGFVGGVATKLRGGTYSQGYDHHAKAFKEQQREYDKEHPNLAWASTIAGTGLGAALPAGRALKGATAGQKIKQGAKVGAGYGALAGAGDGDGLAERAANALQGGLVGGSVGAALPLATDALQAGGRWARRNIPGVDTATRAVTAIPGKIIDKFRGVETPSAATEQANRMIGEQMRIGNITDGFGQPGPASSPRAIASEVNRRNQMSVPAMIGDTTENMRGLTEYASRGAGPGQTLVRQALDSRKALEPQRVRQHVADTFPTVDDPIQYVQGVQQQARERAAPLYTEAYSQPMYRNQGVQGIEQTPAFRNAMPQAFDNIQNQIDPATGMPKSPSAMGFRWFDGDPNGLPPNAPYFPHPSGRGYVAVGDGLSVEGYDQIIRSMRDSGRSAANVNPVTGRIEDTTNSVHINQRAGDLRRELMDQNEPYRRAVEGYGDDMTYSNAFEQGGDVGKLTGHEINAQRRNMPEPANEAWTTGAGTSMADAASAYGAKYPTGATANHVRQMMGDPVKQEAIETMAGNRGGTRELLNRLEYEQQGHINWQGVNGNSRTAQRQQLDNDLDTSAGIPLSKDGAMSRFVNFVTSKAVPRFQQDVKQRIAEVVTASDARTVQEALQAIEEQIERDQSFAQLMQGSGLAATAMYGMNIEPAYPSEN